MTDGGENCADLGRAAGEFRGIELDIEHCILFLALMPVIPNIDCSWGGVGGCAPDFELEFCWKVGEEGEGC